MLKHKSHTWLILFHILLLLFVVFLVIYFLPYILIVIWALCWFPYKILKLQLFAIQSFYSYFLYLTAISFASLTILSRNPIYSLLSLIVVFFHVLIFLLAIKIEFLSLIFLIIYVGAIAILFLFVIMMFNLKQLSLTVNQAATFDTTKILVAILFVYPIVKTFFLIEKYLTIFVLTYVVNSNTAVMNSINLQEIISHKIKDILFFSDIFYTYYAFIFILSSFILFSAMIGAIILVLQPTNKKSSF